MSACTIFGHRDCLSSIKPKLREVLIDLIENHAVDMFYVGQQGAFDGIVHSVLKELVSVYPHIRYAVVLERLPPKRDEFDTRDYSDTMLPEGIETVHPRFAISWRNKWMIKCCYQHHSLLGRRSAVCRESRTPAENCDQFRAFLKSRYASTILTKWQWMQYE